MEKPEHSKKELKEIIKIHKKSLKFYQKKLKKLKNKDRRIGYIHYD